MKKYEKPLLFDMSKIDESLAYGDRCQDGSSATGTSEHCHAGGIAGKNCISTGTIAGKNCNNGSNNNTVTSKITRCTTGLQLNDYLYIEN